MKSTKVFAIILLSLMYTSAFAIETENEKTEATKKELKRETDKAVNRIKEAVCMESDAKCIEEKAKHRVQETTDSVKDKASEIVNKVDD